MLGDVELLVYFDLTFSVQHSNLMGMGYNDGKFLLQNPVTESCSLVSTVRKRIWEWSYYWCVNQLSYFSAEM